MKYKAKFPEVEAIKWDSAVPVRELAEFMGVKTVPMKHVPGTANFVLMVKGLSYPIEFGSYILKLADGNFCALSQRDFENIYDTQRG